MPKIPSFTTSQYEEYLGEIKDEYTKVLSATEEANFPKRILNSDYTLWSSSPDEIVNRLGWLNLPESIESDIPVIKNFSRTVSENNFNSVLLLGMGGSSLAPEMFAKSFYEPGGIDITVLDTTDPDYIRSVRDRLDPAKTFVIVSSKSGSTVETASLLNYFLQEYSKVIKKENLGRYFASITDPGSGLAKLSKSLDFENIFLNNPDIGGRFSALSFFGLVPAALTGLDLEKFMERAGSTAKLCNKNELTTNTGLRLGVLMGCFAENGLDKLTIYSSPEINGLKFWIEQLVAESTGKKGKGILPVPEYPKDLNFSKDQYIVYLKLKGDIKAKKEIDEILGNELPVIVLELEDLYDLAGQIYLWEYATAVAGHILQVNPFDQPNVESAKIHTRQFVEKYKESGIIEKEKPRIIYNGIKFHSSFPVENISSFLSLLEKTKEERGYVAIQAFLSPDTDTESKVSAFAKKITSGYRLPVTAGFGPRYLHSSGQLHKGDSGKGLFIQLTSEIKNDINIPDGPLSEHSSITFGILKNAQALGDYGALKDAGRNIISIDIGSDVDTGLNKLLDIF